MLFKPVQYHYIYCMIYSNAITWILSETYLVCILWLLMNPRVWGLMFYILNAPNLRSTVNLIVPCTMTIKLSIYIYSIFMYYSYVILNFQRDANSKQREPLIFRRSLFQSQLLLLYILFSDMFFFFITSNDHLTTSFLALTRSWWRFKQRYLL